MMVTVVDVPSVGPDIGFSFRTVAICVTGGNAGSLLLGGSDVIVRCIGTETEQSFCRDAGMDSTYRCCPRLEAVLVLEQEGCQTVTIVGLEKSEIVESVSRTAVN